MLSCHQVFNSRATQLVLGAGAIHSAAKLKSISAKHLALCSQSLGLVRSLIPYMKAALATRLPQKHHLLLAQMDAVAQVCQGCRCSANDTSKRVLPFTLFWFGMVRCGLSTHGLQGSRRETPTINFNILISSSPLIFTCIGMHDVSLSCFRLCPK